MHACLYREDDLILVSVTINSRTAVRTRAEQPPYLHTSLESRMVEVFEKKTKKNAKISETSTHCVCVLIVGGVGGKGPRLNLDNDPLAKLVWILLVTTLNKLLLPRRPHRGNILQVE